MSTTERAYLDWNATTPPDPSVVEAMLRASAELWGNPSSVHATGRRARAVVEAARELLAGAVGLEARDVVFTSGASEANNLALCSAPGLATSRLEHPSVVRVAEQLETAHMEPRKQDEGETRIDPEDHRRGEGHAEIGPARGEHFIDIGSGLGIVHVGEPFML